jgi:hypothetical protein
VGEAKARATIPTMGRDLQGREEGLQPPARGHAPIVHERDGADGGRGHRLLRVAGQRHQGLQVDREARGQRGDGPDLGAYEVGPGPEEAAEAAVGLAHEDVLAAGVREHRAQLGVGEGAEERERAARHPDGQDEAGAVQHLGDGAGLEEDARADDGTHHDRRGLRKAQRAQ